MRSPDHHGLFVDDLAGGDGVDLLDVLDLGNGLHDYFIYVCALYSEERGKKSQGIIYISTVNVLPPSSFGRRKRKKKND